MANVTFNRKQFEKEIGKITEDMQHKIAMFGTPVEQLSDDQIELEIFPNRPDLLSYQGFKRSFLAFLGKKTGMQEYKLNKPEKDYKVIVESSVRDVRPYTACAVVKNLDLKDYQRIKEIIDIQEKLHNTLGRRRRKAAIGIYPLEKISFPITYKAIEPEKIKFVPLESPGEREMTGIQILQRHPTGRDYAHLLAGKSKFPIFIDSKKEIMSMPPIINSNTVGKITSTTKEVFIECSGSDFEILKKCLNIIVTSLAEIGGSIYQVEVKNSILPTSKKIFTPDLTPEKTTLSIENTNNLLGLKLTINEVKKLLEKMGYNAKVSNKNLQIEVPAWRTDFLHEVDLIEDIAIAYGYDKLIPKIPEVATIGQENSRESLKRKISNIFSNLGITETSSFHLTTKLSQQTNMGIPEKEENSLIKVQNSKTEYNYLRKDLTHYLLKIISENVDVEYPQRIFEIGKVFEKSNKQIVEKENLSLAITPGNFTELKQIFQNLGFMIGEEGSIKIEEPAIDSKSPDYFIEGRVGEIFYKKKTLNTEQNSLTTSIKEGLKFGAEKLSGYKSKETNEVSIGFLGEIHPKILRNFHLKMPVALLEINLDSILENISNKS